MSSSLPQGSIARIQREIESLERQLTQETSRGADKSKRISQIKASISRTTSASALQSKEREIQRLEHDLVAIHKRRADLEGRIASRTSALHKEQQRLYKMQDRERQ